MAGSRTASDIDWTNFFAVTEVDSPTQAHEDGPIVANIRALATIAYFSLPVRGIDCDAASRHPRRGKIVPSDY